MDDESRNSIADHPEAKTLAEEIVNTVREPMHSPAPTEIPPGAPGEQISVARILLAEDEPIIREVIARLLKAGGWRVETVGSGREALSKWEEGNFDLVLMDLQMPEMNGFEATRAIRGREAAGDRHICIVGLTAHAGLEIREECLKAGMDMVLIKPVRMEELYSAIDGCLSGRKI